MMDAISARELVVWVETDAKKVIAVRNDYTTPEDHGIAGHWVDPIGAAYSQWQGMTNAQRVQLMLETALDLAMQGLPLAEVLRAFASVKEFRALGGKSYPMCRALTAALLGKCLEPNTMPFEELLVHYGPQVNQT